MEEVHEEQKRKRLAVPNLKLDIQAHRAQYLDQLQLKESRMKAEAEERRRNWKAMEGQLKQKRENPHRIKGNGHGNGKAAAHRAASVSDDSSADDGSRGSVKPAARPRDRAIGPPAQAPGQDSEADKAASAVSVLSALGDDSPPVSGRSSSVVSLPPLKDSPRNMRRPSLGNETKAGLGAGDAGTSDLPAFRDPHTPVERRPLLAAASDAPVQVRKDVSDPTPVAAVGEEDMDLPSPRKPSSISRHRKIKRAAIFPSETDTPSAVSGKEGGSQHGDNGSHPDLTSAVSSVHFASDRAGPDEPGVDWITAMLDTDSDEEKLAELYETGFSMIMME